MTGTSDNAILRLLSDSDRTVYSDDEDIRGRKVTDSDGKDLGHVADLLIDERELKVRLLLVEHGGFLGLGRTKSLIPVDDLTGIDDDEVRVDHTKGHVATGPTYDPDLVADTTYVGSVYSHYDYTPYWGAGYVYPAYPFYPAMH